MANVWVGGSSHESFHRRYQPKPVITKPHTYPASQAVTMTGSGRYAYLPAITIHPDGTWTVAE